MEKSLFLQTCLIFTSVCISLVGTWATQIQHQSVSLVNYLAKRVRLCLHFLPSLHLCERCLHFCLYLCRVDQATDYFICMNKTLLKTLLFVQLIILVIYLQIAGIADQAAAEATVVVQVTMIAGEAKKTKSKQQPGLLDSSDFPGMYCFTLQVKVKEGWGTAAP